MKSCSDTEKVLTIDIYDNMAMNNLLANGKCLSFFFLSIIKKPLSQTITHLKKIKENVLQQKHNILAVCRTGRGE